MWAITELAVIGLVMRQTTHSHMLQLKLAMGCAKSRVYISMYVYGIRANMNTTFLLPFWLETFTLPKEVNSQNSLRNAMFATSFAVESNECEK